MKYLLMTPKGVLIPQDELEVCCLIRQAQIIGVKGYKNVGRRTIVIDFISHIPTELMLPIRKMDGGRWQTELENPSATLAEINKTLWFYLAGISVMQKLNFKPEWAGYNLINTEDSKIIKKGL